MPRPGGTPENLRPPWKKGESGNKSKTPRGKSITTRLREMLERDEIGGQRLPGGKQVADLLVEAMVKEAAKGKLGHLREILDRTEGKAPERAHGPAEEGVQTLRQALHGEDDDEDDGPDEAEEQTPEIPPEGGEGV